MLGKMLTHVYMGYTNCGSNDLEARVKCLRR
jgi:hypothetical protein